MPTLELSVSSTKKHGTRTYPVRVSEDEKRPSSEIIMHLWIVAGPIIDEIRSLKQQSGQNMC